MTKTIVCRTCGRLQDYDKPIGVSGRPPSSCKEHRGRQRGEKSWTAIGEPYGPVRA